MGKKPTRKEVLEAYEEDYIQRLESEKSTGVLDEFSKQIQSADIQSLAKTKNAVYSVLRSLANGYVRLGEFGKLGLTSPKEYGNAHIMMKNEEFYKVDEETESIGLSEEASDMMRDKGIDYVSNKMVWEYRNYLLGKEDFENLSGKRM